MEAMNPFRKSSKTELSAVCSEDVLIRTLREKDNGSYLMDPLMQTGSKT